MSRVRQWNLSYGSLTSFEAREKLRTLKKNKLKKCYVGSVSLHFRAFPFVLRLSFMFPFILRPRIMHSVFLSVNSFTLLGSGHDELDHQTELSTWPDYVLPFYCLYLRTSPCHLR